MPSESPGPRVRASTSAAPPSAQEGEQSTSVERQDGDDTLIRFRVSHIDTVQSHEPVPQLGVRASPFYPQGEKMRAVPVLRIFGATDRGQRVVAHVHGGFPYLFVEYDGPLDPDSVNSHILKLGKAMNHFLRLSYSKRTFTKSPQYVAFIVACKGIPFYGYHVGYRVYLKIYLCDPTCKKRLGEGLRSGAILGKEFAVFEEHLPFIAQWMIDHNVLGCGWLEVKNCLFRLPLPPHVPSPSDAYDPPTCSGPYSNRIYTELTVPSSSLHSSHGPTKISYCPIELDLSCEAINNRHQLKPRNLHHDFIELRRSPNDKEPREKYVLSVKELWDQQRKRAAAKGQAGPSDYSGPDEEREWDSRDPDEPIWGSEEALRIALDKRLKDDRLAYGTDHSGRMPSEKTFVGEDDSAQRKGYIATIKTAHEQTDAVYQERMVRDEQESYPYAAWAVKGIGIDSHEAQIKRRMTSEPPEVDEGRWRRMVAAEQSALSQLKKAAAPAGVDVGPSQDSDEGGEERDDREDDDAEDRLEQLARDEAEFEEDQEERDDEAVFGTQDQQEVAGSLEIGDAGEEGLFPVKEEVKEEELPDVEMKWDPSSDEFGSPPPAQQSRQATVDVDAQVEDVWAGAPSQKRIKRSHTAEASREPQTTVNTFETPRSRRHPFASPNKDVRVKFACDMPQEQPQEEQMERDFVDIEARTTGTSRSSSPLLPNQAIHDNLDDQFADLPSDMFVDDYLPTPTVAAPAPSVVPFHLRSELSEREAASPTSGTPSQPTPPVPSTSLRSPSSSSPPSPRIAEPSPEPSVATTETATQSPAPLPQASRSQSQRQSQSQLSVPSAQRSTLSTSAVEIVTDELSGTDSTRSLLRLSPVTPPYVTAKDCFTWSPKPPTSAELMASIESFGQARVVYQEAFYSKRGDVPHKPREYGGRKFALKGSTFEFIKPFSHWNVETPALASKTWQVAIARPPSSWEFGAAPPSLREARDWLSQETLTSASSAETAKREHVAAAAQIEGPTQRQGGYQFVAAKSKTAEPGTEKQHLALLSMELQVSTRDKLFPDPEHDAITALFYCFQSENENLTPNGRSDDRVVGVIAVGGEELKARLGSTHYLLHVVDHEYDLIDLFLTKMKYEWDPEIVAGYEVHNASWGYLIERADKAHGWNIVDQLGRLSQEGNSRFGNKVTDRWGFDESTTLNFAGRHVFPIWRILRADNNFARYTFEHVAFSVLGQRTPRFSHQTLTRWWTDGVPHQISRVFEYWRNRVEMNVEMLEQAEVIAQNCEFAYVYGIDFKSVRTRGSQFKVESVMFRISKPESYMLPSPNRVEVGKQNAAECQPLVMEPKSAFYKGPLLVLDFQSLYPSVMIGYNLCYSTCLGRIEAFKGKSKLGTYTYDPAPGLLNLMKKDVNISPNGMLFVKSHVRESLLAKMLRELLDTRVMVKNGMKGEKDTALLKLMNARQLALKLLANVTYGYTSATFSGRMPCVEIADAIVQIGRETLERALETVRTTAEWGAEVVYGDTDSLFIYLPGKSKEDAFRIGNEIADKVTSMNPRPIKLKFEKVYLPSVLLAKKRYVGFKYEHLTETRPGFDAKGIETVRRDGIFAVQKMQETCLKILFRTSDLSQVKEFCQRQWAKLMAGDVSPQDFTFAKEVRLGSYSTKGPPPPGAMVATRMMEKDPRAEPGYKDRVPYVVIQAEPNTRIVDRSLHPEEFLEEPRLRLDVAYYIQNVMIPPLARIFNLVGADVLSWYQQMKKTHQVAARTAEDGSARPARIDEHFASDLCVVCNGPSAVGVDMCDSCRSHPTQISHLLMNRSRAAILRQKTLHLICSSCEGTPQGEEVSCQSLDCPTLYERKKADVEAGKARDAMERVRRLML